MADNSNSNNTNDDTRASGIWARLAALPATPQHEPSAAGRRGRGGRAKGGKRHDTAHLEASGGRVVDQPCHGCLKAGREHAAHTHYDHECKHKDALGRRSALKRFRKAQESLPALQQPAFPSTNATTTRPTPTGELQELPPPPPAPPSLASAFEDPVRVAFRDHLESFTRDNNHMSLLQAAENYRERLRWDRLTSVQRGEPARMDGRVFVWLDAYIDWLKDSSS